MLQKEKSEAVRRAWRPNLQYCSKHSALEMPLPNSFGRNQCLEGSFLSSSWRKKPNEAIWELPPLVSVAPANVLRLIQTSLITIYSLWGGMAVLSLLAAGMLV